MWRHAGRPVAERAHSRKPLLDPTQAFGALLQDECRDKVKPEFWHDEGLKALSARVLAAPDQHSNANALYFRADVRHRHHACSARRQPSRAEAQVLDPYGFSESWKKTERTAAERQESAELYRRAAEIVGRPPPPASTPAPKQRAVRSPATSSTGAGKKRQPPLEEIVETVPMGTYFYSDSLGQFDIRGI